MQDNVHIEADDLMTHSDADGKTTRIPCWECYWFGLGENKYKTKQTLEGQKIWKSMTPPPNQFDSSLPSSTPPPTPHPPPKNKPKDNF